jgi:hypothetical protein
MPHTFVAGDQMSVYLPGATSPLGSISLAGITIPANTSVFVVVRAAAFGYEPTQGIILASQGEDLVIQ